VYGTSIPTSIAPRYAKLCLRHTILGVPVRYPRRIIQLILRWRYDPVFKCVKARVSRQANRLGCTDWFKIV
jgi:hypothetical protein